MNQRTIDVSRIEIDAKSPKKKHITNKTNFYHIDETWSLDVLDLTDSGPENNRGYRYFLIFIVSFSQFGSKVPLIQHLET